MSQCEFCGTEGIVRRYVSRSYGNGDNLLVIENVPILSCPHCGESYLTAQTLHAIEHLKKNRHLLASKRSVEVAVLV